MIDVLDIIKQAYDRSTTQVDKIIINGKEYRISNVEYYDDTYLDGNIFGTAIGKNIDFEIENTIDLEGQEIEYLTGIITNGTTHWISLGKFIIQDVQSNNTTNISKVTATDYMLKTNIPYVSDLDYESGKITLLNVLQEVCAKSGLTLATTSFTNSTFIVDSNQFTEETLNRQVIQAVAQVSGTVAKIRNNQLYLINPNTITTVSKVFTLNNYKEAEIKRATHPINLVSLGMADVEGENITLRDESSIIKNGENSLVINDNPFAYTQAKREQLITALFDAVKGFEYKSYSFKCQGLPYLETLDKIQFKDKEGNTYDSFIFKFNDKSPNGLESTIEAPSITKATVAYQNIPSALDIAKRTEIIVDKQNQTIQAVIEETNELQSQVTDITTTQATLEGTEIKIDDGAEEPIIKLEVDGHSTQEGTPTPEAPVEIQSVGDDVNLFDKNTAMQGYIDYNNGQFTSVNTYTSSDFIEIDGNANYFCNYIIYNSNAYGMAFYDKDKNYISGSVLANSFVTPSNAKYYRFCVRNENYNGNYITDINTIKLQKGTVATAYSEYGKGTVEIKQSGKNLLNVSNEFIVTKAIWDISIDMPIGTYTLSVNEITTDGTEDKFLFLFYYDDGTSLSKFLSSTNKSLTFNIEKQIVEVNIYSQSSNASSTDVTTTYKNLMISKEGGDYKPYKTNNYGIPLSQPLRSLPNGVKDTIEEDGIHRRVGRVVLDGSEDGWNKDTNTDNTVDYFYIKGIGIDKNNIDTVICNRFQKGSMTGQGFWATTVFCITINKEYTGIVAEDTKEQRIAKFKTWLQANPIQVDYELAEEVIEPFDEEQQAVIDSISTMLGTQYFTCDANMRITYVRDNGLSDMYETKQNASKRSAQLQIQIDEINSKVESVEDLTVGVSGTKSVTLENCAKGSLLKLQIKGNNEVFKHLYPSDTLYPSDNLYPYGDSRIKVKNNDGEKIYELGVTDVLRAKGNVYDEYILENGIAKVIRRINTNGTVKTTPTEEVIGEYSIDLAEGTNTLEIVNYSALINLTYAEKSAFTDVFSTKVETDSKIQQRADEIDISVNQKLENYSTTAEMHSAILLESNKINLEVGKKVNNEDFNGANIMLAINNDVSSAVIRADKIDIDGKAVRFKTNISVTIGPFTNTDRTKMINYLMNTDTLTQEEIERYDINGDGKINSADVVLVTKAITNGGYYTFSGYYEINPYSHDKSIRIFDNEQNRFETILSLVHNYINYLYTEGVNIEGQLIVKNECGQMFTQLNNDDMRFELYTDGDIRAENQITCNNLVQSSLLEKKKNFERLENGLEIVKNIDIYKYNLKSEEDETKKHIGFVIGDNYNYSQEITSKNNDGVDTYSMISVAYKAIQEQQELIEQLRNEIKELKGENNGEN